MKKIIKSMLVINVPMLLLGSVHAANFQSSDDLNAIDSEPVVRVKGASNPVPSSFTAADTVVAATHTMAGSGYDQYAASPDNDTYQQQTYVPPVSYEAPEQVVYQQPEVAAPVSYDVASTAQVIAQPTVNTAPQTAAASGFSAGELGERLLTAARAGNVNDVRWLLRKGADPDYKAHSEALSPLDLVVQGGWVDIAEVFHNEGVNFNKRGNLGVTFLHQAAATGKLEMVKFLVNAGVSPNTTTSKDWTALHHAARFGHEQVVAYLLAAGANSAHRNSDGFMARDLAVNARHVQVAQLF